MIKYYVKKPIPVRAVQYINDNREEILSFTDGKAFFRDENGIKELIIHTLEGDMKAAPGCYIVMGPYGEPYPVQEDIFKETYEEVKML